MRVNRGPNPGGRESLVCLVGCHVSRVVHEGSGYTRVGRKDFWSEVDKLMHSPSRLLPYNCTQVFGPGESLFLVNAQPHSQLREKPRMPPMERKVKAKTTLSHWSRAILDPVWVFMLTSGRRQDSRHTWVREIEPRCLQKVLCVRRGLKFSIYQKDSKKAVSLIEEELFLWEMISSQNLTCNW